MKKFTTILTLAAFIGCSPQANLSVSTSTPPVSTTRSNGKNKMHLGNFSVSLAVKDLTASRQFYETLGFQVVGGNGTRFSILQNETSTLGLFQGMFDKNILTFNPGWDRDCTPLSEFQDVREIQRDLASKGVTFATKADEASH